MMHLMMVVQWNWGQKHSSINSDYRFLLAYHGYHYYPGVLDLMDDL
jgi:hypothetical protein